MGVDRNSYLVYRRKIYNKIIESTNVYIVKFDFPKGHNFAFLHVKSEKQRKALLDKRFLSIDDDIIDIHVYQKSYSRKKLEEKKNLNEDVIQQIQIQKLVQKLIPDIFNQSPKKFSIFDENYLNDNFNRLDLDDNLDRFYKPINFTDEFNPLRNLFLRNNSEMIENERKQNEYHDKDKFEIF